ncbi:unnamed protein product, partial [Brassica oleracea var. botrytis]
MIYTADSWTPNKILFPKALIGSTRSADTAKIDHDLTSKKLLYAANWTMEQEEDIQLYRHPIWSHISSCRKHLKSLCKLDPDAFPIPMMSSKLIDIAASNEQSKPLSKTLFESLSSVGVLRLTYQQWLAENNYNHTDVSSFIRFLDSLRALEKKILSEIVGSPSFTVSIQLYIEVIEKHSFFWSDLVSSSDECKLFFFWSLIKAIKKLDSSFPKEVHVVLQEESKNINNIALHGNDHLTKAIAFSDPELCLLALEGLCISSYIADKDDAAALQLDEIYQVCFLYSTVCNQMSLSALTVDHHHQMFLERMELEKKRMQDRMVYSENDNIENRSAACCIFRPEIVATGFGFTGWMEIYSIARSESSSLDVELLAVLQHLLVAQSTEHKDLLDIRNLHKPALEYSLSSTRPPQTLVAHQKLLWAIDARASVLRVDTKIAGFVLEMWYWWHSVLWKNCQIGLMSISEIGNCRIMSHSMLIQLVKTATIDQILHNAFAVKDYPLHFF